MSKRKGPSKAKKEHEAVASEEIPRPTEGETDEERSTRIQGTLNQVVMSMVLLYKQTRKEGVMGPDASYLDVIGAGQDANLFPHWQILAETLEAAQAFIDVSEYELNATPEQQKRYVDLFYPRSVAVAAGMLEADEPLTAERVGFEMAAMAGYAYLKGMAAGKM